MKPFLSILFCAIILISCTKSKVEPISIIKFDLEDQHFEKQLHRLYKIQVPESELYLNGYGIYLDSVIYKGRQYLASISLLSFVYYHPDSIEYKHDSSKVEIRLDDIIDSTIIHFSSQICVNNSFEFVIDQLEMSDNINGYYSGRFGGDLCDSIQENSISIKSGRIIRARL